jgi:threonine synthase
MPLTSVTHLECSLCSRKYEPGKPSGTCECGGLLFVRYDLPKIRRTWPLDSLASAPQTMWRYAPVLPVPSEASIITFGEGMTPLLPARRTASRIGAADLLIKDEGRNPTGSAQARGMSCAVSVCVDLGLRRIAIASAGNAAGALAAYAAAAGIEAHIFIPDDVSQASFIECKACGAHVTLVNGPLGDCIRIVAERGPREGWFDLSPLREPYRIEGQKTIGYEIAEQLGWHLPDAILYPTRSGAGMTAASKAFDELQALGWIPPKRPQMIAVEAGDRQPFAEAIAAGIQLADEEGIFTGPAGAACVLAAARLIREGALKPSDQIVICNMSSGLKHLEAYSTRFPRLPTGQADKLGGLITPR